MDDFNQSGTHPGASCSLGSNQATVRGRACFVRSAPTGTNPFIWNGYFFHTPLANGTCPPGTIQGPQGNCQCEQIPTGKVYFIEGQNFYIECDNSNPYPNDYVNGYGLYQIENALVNANTRWDFYNNLKNLYWNPCEGVELARLFNDYNGINP